jgi:hypothetical protein
MAALISLFRDLPTRETANLFGMSALDFLLAFR